MSKNIATAEQVTNKRRGSILEAEKAGEVPQEQRKALHNQSHDVWVSYSGTEFYPGKTACAELVPGIYTAANTPNGLCFSTENSFNDEGLINFNDSEIQKVIEDIRKFWTLEEKFEQYNLVYKRGILLYGPPGSGKSSAIKIAVNDVINEGGIGIVFNSSYQVREGLKMFRKIQPNTPVVIIMEDLESIFKQENDTDILNLLDGVNELHKVCFIATTNYPEQLEPRVKNRPSRFDKRYEIGSPTAETRKQYLEFLFKDNLEQYNLNKWIDDTKNFSLAHIKELFISVVLYGHDYDESVLTIRNMNKKISSEKERSVGFSNGINDN